MAQEIFERVEKKYLLDTADYLNILPELIRFMRADAYGKYTVSNIYFDSPDYSLIRSSFEKPVYKEKLRLRCYGEPGEEKTVFVEIKKKYAGVVFKRRIDMKLKDARRYLYCGFKPDLDNAGFVRKQIFREIDYMKNRNSLQPAVMIAYDRIAFIGKENPDLRVTFDNNIRCRDYDLDLRDKTGGRQLLNSGQILMEVKLNGSMPLWMGHILEKLSDCRTSFSKYGEFYRIIQTEKERKEGGKICA